MNRVATASPEIRSQAFDEAAARLGMPAAIVEKDFWVCWLLGLLFGGGEDADRFVFKGGTALSKVFRVIQRFSEDIDLSLNPDVLGISEEDAAELTGRRSSERFMKRLESLCCE